MSENAQAQSSATPAAPPKKKKKRRVLRFFLYLFVFLFLLVALAPTIISTGWGTSFVLSFVNKSIPGSIEVDDLSVGWFSGVSVEGLKIKDPDGKVVIAADMTAPSIKLFPLVTGSRDFGEVTLTATTCEIIGYEDGTNNLSRAFGPGKEKEPKKDEGPATMPPGLVAKVTVKAPKATYAAPMQQTITVSDFELVAEVKNPSDIAARIGAKLSQGAYSTDVSLAASVKDAFGTDGKMQRNKSNIDIVGSLPLPSPMIDELGKQDGRITALAGPLVTTKVTVKGTLAQMNTTLDVDAERLKVKIPLVASLSDDMKLKHLVKPQTEGEIAYVKITETTMSKFAPKAGTLKEPVELRAFLEKTDVVFQDGGQKPDMTATRASVRVTADPIIVNTGTKETPKYSTLEIKSFEFTYDGPAGQALATIEVVATQEGKSGRLVLQGDVREPLTKDGQLNWKTLKVEKGSVEIKDFALGVLDDVAGTAGFFVGLLGDKLQAEGTLAISPAPDGKSASGTMDFTARTDDGRLVINLIGGQIEAQQVEKDGKTSFVGQFKTTQPGEIKLQTSQKTLDLLASKIEGMKKLAQQIQTPQSTLVVKINDVLVPIGPDMMRKARAQLAVNLGPITMDLNQEGQTNPDLKVTLKDTVATLDFNGPENKVTATLAAGATAGDQTGSLSASANIANLIGIDGMINVNALAPVIVVQATDMPTALADAFIGKGRLAHEALGPTMGATINTTVTQVAGKQGPEALAGPVSVAISSKNATVNLAGEIKGGRIAFDATKDQITFNATPALVAELKRGGTLKLPDEMKDLAITAPIPVALDVTPVDLPLDGKQLKTAKVGFVLKTGAINPIGDARLAGVSIPTLTATLTDTTLSEGVKLVIDTDVKKDATTGTIHADAKLTKLFSAEDKIDPANSPMDVKLTVTNLPTPLADAFIKKGQLGSVALGPTINATVAATLNRTPGKEAAEAFTGPVSVTLDSANTKIALEGAMAGGRLKLDETKDTIRFAATPALVAELKNAGMLKLPEDNKALSIAQAATLTVDLKQFDVPLNRDLLKTAKIGLTAAIDRVEPTGDARLQGASIETLLVTIPNVTLDQPLNVTLGGKLKQGAQSGNLAGAATLRHLFDKDKEKQVSGNITITDAPTALVDALGSQGGFLVEQFGPKIPLVFASIEPTVAPQTMRAKFKIESTTINGGGTIDLATRETGNRITAIGADGKAPIQLTVVLTPKAFAAFQKKYGEKLPAMLKGAALVAETKVDIAVNVADLAMVKAPEAAASRGTTGTTFAAQTAAEGASPEVKSEGLPILAKESKLDMVITTNGPFLRKEGVASAVKLDNVSIAIKSPQDLNTLNLNLAADTTLVPLVGGQPQIDPNAKKGKITSVTSVPGLANDKGRVDFSRIDLNTLKTDTQITNLPTKDLTTMLGMSPKVGGAVGTIETATIKSGQNGNMVVNLKSDNMTANVVGTIKDNKLTPSEDPVVTMKSNEVMNEVFFHPMFGGVLQVESSENPIAVKMLKDGFTVPTSGFSIENVSTNMVIDLGKMNVRPRFSMASLPKELGGVNQLLKLAGVDIDKGLNRAFSFLKDASPTFDPLDATLSKGVLKYNKPLKFTVDKYTFSLDGNVDLKTNTPKMTLNIPLAVFGDGMEQKLGKFLGPTFPLPLAGSIENPQLDSGAFGKLMENIQKNLGRSLIPGLGGNNNDNKQPGVGGILGDILGGNKKDPPKDPPKEQPKQPDNPQQPKQEPPQNPDADKKEEPRDPLQDLFKGLIDRSKKKEEDKK